MEALLSLRTILRYARVMEARTQLSQHTATSRRLPAQFPYLSFKLHHTIFLGDPTSTQLYLLLML